MDETVQKTQEQQEQIEVVNSGMKGNFVPSYKFFGFVQADLQILSLLEVCDRDDLTHIIVDGVELGHSVNRTRQIINKRGKMKSRLETRTVDHPIYCA